MTEPIEHTLEKRGGKYGTIENNAFITQSMMDILAQGKNWDMWSHTHKECSHMICHKMARMVSGDPWYDDNPLDIEGYARLLSDYIHEIQKLGPEQLSFNFGEEN